MKRELFPASYLVCLLLFSVFIPTVAVFADGQANLIGWWRMDGQTDPTNARIVKDYSGNGNDGTMGSADAWIPGGGIDFDGGSWGASGIVFPSAGADLVADMALSNQVTISYVATWDTFPGGTNYPYDGRDSTDLRILSSECPTSSMHIRDHKGGTDLWCWDSFDDTNANFIFGKVGKTWGDYIRITTSVDFTTGDYKIYVDNQLYNSATGKTGSFEDLSTFTIGRTLWAEMEGKMKDFRIYDDILTLNQILELTNPDYGLVCRYSFDEADGSVAYDLSGNENDATFSRSDRWNSQGKWGGCLSNDYDWGTFYGQVPIQAFSGISDTVTVAFWAKNTAKCDQYGSGAFFKATDAAGSTVFSSSIYKNSSTPTNHYLITRAGDNDDTGYWWWGYDHIYNDQLDQWHHIAFTMDHTTRKLTKYYNGKPFTIAHLLSDDLISGINSFGLFSGIPANLSDIKYYHCYHGMMDEFRIYDRVLSLGELRKLSSPNPKFAYNPDPADNNVLQDRQLLLTFLAADGAQEHNIYFGENYDDVDAADINSAAFAGTFDLGVTEFDPGYLRAGRQYYWRVDEVYPGQTVKGPVWSFTTIKNNIDLYMLIGQSNMCVASDVNPEDDIPNIHIVRFDKRDSRWKLLDPNDVGGIGPAPSFALGMIESREDTVVGIVHAALSGTPQSRWLKGQDLYENAIDRAQAAMQFGTLRGVLWHQGESEAGNLLKALSYGSNLKDMINDMRADLGISDLPFVLGQLGDFNTQSSKGLINSGIQSAADDLVNVKVASPSGLTCWDDSIHFTSDSQRIYGFRYAAKMMEMVGTRTTTADVNGDSDVDWEDLGLIAEKWLELADYGNSKDINNDGEVNVYDFVIMGRQWGQ